MVQYTADTEQIARGYNLTPEEVILSFAIAAGAPAPDAYRLIYHKPAKTTTEELQQLADSFLRNKTGAKILINRIKNHQNPTTLRKQQQQEAQQTREEDEEERERRRDEYTTRQGLLVKIIDSVASSEGKDKIQGLTTLAKMQGFEKPEESAEEEKRQYFLPWVSHCRSCKLMKLYREMAQAEDASK